MQADRQALGIAGRVLVVVGVMLATHAGIAYAADAAAASGLPSAELWSWVLSSGVPGLLLIGFVKLWSWANKKIDEKDHQLKTDKETWAAEKIKLKEQFDKDQDRAWEEARRDKADLRNTFEHDRSAMILKLESMQAKLEKEQVDRREEAERLLREQTTLTREVMATAQAMTSSLQENTRMIEKFHDVLQRGG